MTAFQTDEWGRFYEQEYSDTEKDIAALNIGIQAIERNQAAIDECKGEITYLEDCIKRNGARDNNTYADGCRNAYKNILKILEAEQ